MCRFSFQTEMNVFCFCLTFSLFFNVVLNQMTDSYVLSIIFESFGANQEIFPTKDNYCQGMNGVTCKGDKITGL